MVASQCQVHCWILFLIWAWIFFTRLTELIPALCIVERDSRVSRNLWRLLTFQRRPATQISPNAERAPPGSNILQSWTWIMSELSYLWEHLPLKIKMWAFFINGCNATLKVEFFPGLSVSVFSPVQRQTELIPALRIFSRDSRVSGNLGRPQTC